jgi:Cu(I)/Ag(I) efflux system membrane fusion protein
MKTPAFLNRLADSPVPRLLLAVFAGWVLHDLVTTDIGESHEHAGPSAEAPAADTPADAAPAFWTCSMDPQVRAPEPGLCPICGMELIAATAGGDDLAPRQLRLSENALALAGVRTTAVERRAVGRELRLAGSVAHDETRVASVSNWMPGRLDRLFVTATGVTIREGDHLAELYNPDLLSLERELLDAEASLRSLDADAPGARREIAQARASAARQSLLDLGISQQEIREVLSAGTPRERLTLWSPIGGTVTEKHVQEGDYVQTGAHLYTIADLSKVWVELDAYESDLAWLRFGQDVSFTVVAYPGREFHGRVASVDPTLDSRTRTARVRVNVENPELLLMPGMFVRATVIARLTEGGNPVDPSLAGKWMCPMHPEVVADGAGDCPDCGMPLEPVAKLGFAPVGEALAPLVIPASAALITGRRAVVYVRVPGDPDAEEPQDPLFEGREVVLGPRAGDAFIVREGLAEGELVVIAGAFTLDSELQLQAKTSMMSADDDARPAPALDVPRAVREQVGAVLEADAAVAQALASDDLEAARAAATATGAATETVDLATLGLEDGRRAEALLAAVRERAKQVAEAADIDAARVVFEHLQHASLTLAEDLGYALADGPTLSVFHCPMAFDNRGADWLQWSGTRTENPYFGSSMYRCGKEQTVIATGTGGR